MNEREYDLILAEAVGSLPPEPRDQSEPWSAAMRRILWGLALVTIRLELLWLNYILPCAGAVLVFLGFRSLRRSALGFARAYAVSIVLLLMQALNTAQAAARPGLIAGWLSWCLIGASFLLNMCLLLGLRSGIRSAFDMTGGERPRDLALWAAAAYACVFALALLNTISPARSEAGSYIRPLAALAIYISLLLLLRRQGRELAGRGYRITPVPVRFRTGTVFVLYTLLIALLLVPAMLLGPRPAMAEAEALSTEGSGTRDALTRLGMSEWLADSLTEEELELCEGLDWVREVSVDKRGSDRLGGGKLELECWAVGLADGRTRFYAAFRWVEPPRFRIQEALSLEPDPNAAISDASGRLVYSDGGKDMTVPFDVEFGGGQTAEELDEFGLSWYEADLKWLGHVQYRPYTCFALPLRADKIRGWLAYTYDGGLERLGDGTIFGSAVLRHQAGPRYPFRDLGAEGTFAGSDGNWYRVDYML